jgi:hypothetical protein
MAEVGVTTLGQELAKLVEKLSGASDMMLLSTQERG